MIYLIIFGNHSQNVRQDLIKETKCSEPIVSYIIKTFFTVLTVSMPSIVSKCRRYIYTESVIHLALREFIDVGYVSARFIFKN